MGPVYTVPGDRKWTVPKKIPCPEGQGSRGGMQINLFIGFIILIVQAGNVGYYLGAVLQM